VTAEALLPQDRYYEDRYTGYLDCQLITQSPTYVRCGLTPQEHRAGKESKDQTDFFYTDPVSKEPVVPGSSLRGMLRALVEIVSYGKVQPVTDQKLVYRAVGDTTSFGMRYRERLMHLDEEGYQGRQRYHAYTPLMKAGYMEKRGFDWSIRPAQSIGGTTFARIWKDSVPQKLGPWDGSRNAGVIWIKPGRYEYKDVRGGLIKVKFSNVERFSATEDPDLIQGAWIRSGKMFSKRFDMVVFPADTECEAIPIPDKLVMAYRDQISREQMNLLGKEGVLRDKQPVFYLVEDGELVFFSHTMMMRLPYENSPRHFVPPELRSARVVDLAEAIFGYVDLTAEEPSRAGRVSVSDGTLMPDQSDPYLVTAPFAPRILSSPKPTTHQHYLVQQTPDEQPDGYTKDHKPKYKVVLAHYASPTPEDTVIRGHKLYWHRGNVGRQHIEEPEQLDRGTDRQHTWLRPLRSGVMFCFRIAFENLNTLELGALLWALTLPGPGEYCHKLGTGKPLGMGAVRIKTNLRLTNRKDRYCTLFEGAGWALGEGRPDVGQVQADSLYSFEQAILSTPLISPGHQAQSLADLPRIKELLAMLSWPGPASAETEYITSLKEFTERKVLPTPSDVIAGSRVSPPKPRRDQNVPSVPAPVAPRRKPMPQGGDGPKVGVLPRPRNDTAEPTQSPTSPLQQMPSPPASGPHTGRVTYYNFDDGQGTVLLDGSDQQVKITAAQLRKGVRYLAANQRVSFTVVPDGEGIHLKDVGPE
jgi:CRISPR-associated protein (TIGR03986 family)